MKAFLLLLVLGSFTGLFASCSRTDRDMGDIQREEAIDRNDVREDDSYDRAFPIDSEVEDVNTNVNQND
jgi:hypothetical protein